MRITDAQIHVITRNSPERPWPYDVNEHHGWVEFGKDRVLAEMEAAGVDRAVLVPSAVEGNRNDTCLAAAQAHPDRFAVVGRLALDESASRSVLPDFLEVPGMMGIRVSFNRGASGNWLDGTADWFWPAAERARIPLYVNIPRMPARIRSIAQKYPQLKLAIDHLSLTTTLQDHEIDALLDELVGLAPLPNVAVKATSLPSIANDVYPFKSMHARLERVLEAFGRHRVFWGSDLTKLPCPYRQCVTMFTEQLDFLSTEDLDWFMGRALEEWFGWDAVRR